MNYFDPDNPATWPLQFYDRRRLQAWPDPLLKDVATQLRAIREASIEVAFAMLMVDDEIRRRQPASVGDL